MGTDNALKIVKALQSNNTSLKEFTIASNNIGSEAANKIAVILAHNTELQKLKMTQNELEEGCVNTILRGLKDNFCL